MKIVAIVRTRNEEANIGRFCAAYEKWVDQIIVADGGSTDRTVITANEHGAEVRLFDKLVESNGVTRNPEGEHVQYLIDAAKEHGADWVIFDDCDCVPNYALREDGRMLIEEAAAEGKRYVYAVRLYLWGNGSHFPYLAKPGEGHAKWEPSLWAWCLDSGLAPKTNNPWLLSWPEIPPDEVSYLYPSYCLLHRPWPTETVLKRKMEFYNTAAMTDDEKTTHEDAKPRLMDPRKWGGPIEALPEWAVEERYE